MIDTKTIIAVLALAGALLAGPVVAQEEEAGGHGTAHIEKQSWTFAGIFGTYDEHQLQRGFQVFREVCSQCHSARLMAFRNLAEPGGPEFSEEQVKALAAEYQIPDESVEGGTRPGVPADRWPSPFASEQEAREIYGTVPPDFSVLAKARGVTDAFPFWAFNYFTGYQEGGPDYIHALLLGYHEEPPEGVELPPGAYYNEVFPGNAILMAPPLFDGAVDYAEGEDEATVPETLDQYAKDVSAFMMWMAEPHLVSRKETGFRVLLFLVVFAGLMWAVKNRLWKGIEH